MDGRGGLPLHQKARAAERKTNIDPGIAKMAALFKDNECQLIENVEHTHQNLLAEEVWICPHFGARTEKAAAAGAPVEFILPKEGGLSWIFNTGIVAGRPDESREVAEQFVGSTLDAGEPDRILAPHRLPADQPRSAEQPAGRHAEHLLLRRAARQSGSGAA